MTSDVSFTGEPQNESLKIFRLFWYFEQDAFFPGIKQLLSHCKADDEAIVAFQVSDFSMRNNLFFHTVC